MPHRPRPSWSGLIVALLLPGALLAAPAPFPSMSPLAPAASPDGIDLPGTPATVAFTETDFSGRLTRRLTLRLTLEPVDTCLGGEWRRAVAVADDSAVTRQPAYLLSGGRLEVLLVNGACDDYDAYIGRLAGAVFEGQHVSQGLGTRAVRGRVRGHYGPARP